MNSYLLPYDELMAFCKALYCGFGFNQTESAIISDVLLLSDLYGIRSHGVQRTFRYHRGINEGDMHVDAKPTIVKETPLSAVIDGNMGMGQLVGHYAMSKAIEKAKQSGIGIVTVRNSNHYGIAGYYAKMACDQGLIGISCTNTAAVAVPTFGRRAMLGTNPIAIAVPAEPFPFLFDASTTVVARGKIEVYNKLNKELPGEWAVNAEGVVTPIPAEALECTLTRDGGMLPLGGFGEENGGYKGYGYGIVCELFSSILSLSATCNHVSIRGGGVSHGFIAIDPEMFGDPDEIRNHFSKFLQELRESPMSAGAERIYTHGEKEQLAYEDCMKNGIPVDEKTWQEMQSAAESVGVNILQYFSDLKEG